MELTVSDAAARRDQLKGVWERARGCERCPLHQTRTQVVFGAGNADADLMFVGEAPGANEDRLGLPFVGQAGKLLDRMLGEIGLERGDVFVANTIKCRPPGNRDPHPNEIESCQSYLWEQVALIEPTVICTLGNFATKLLRGDVTGISRLHGQAEERVIGTRRVRLYPLYHPAAALYTPSMLETLRADFARIPELLAMGPPEQALPPVHGREEWEALDPERGGAADASPSQDPIAAADALLKPDLGTTAGAAAAPTSPGEMLEGVGATGAAQAGGAGVPPTAEPPSADQLGLF